MAEMVVFHHAHGLTSGVAEFAEGLRQAGHTVHTPDLFEGRLFDTLEEGVAHAQEIGFGAIIERGRRAAEGLPGGIVYAGFSMGVLPAQMLAQTRPGARGAELFHACLPASEFGGAWPSGVPVQIHGMDGDELFVGEGADGQLGYDDSESGLWGDVILVNGRPWPVMRVKRRVYRFRMLVGSISRSYRFALDTGDPVTVVATDGGLMPRARQVDQWRHSTAERYEVLIDFGRYRPGQRVVLRNLSNDNNVDYDSTDMVMAFQVTDAPFDRRDRTWHRIPDRLVDSDVMGLTEAMAQRRRHLAFERKHGLWTVNGRTWTDVVNSDFEQLIADPGHGDVEVWEVENRSGGWFHPVHIHLVDFKILSRNGRAPFDYERGPKDTVYVGENETVRLLMRFGPHRGRYMVHCHNLVHEDHDMMHQFAVGWRPGQPDPNHPILADPPRPDPAYR